MLDSISPMLKKVIIIILATAFIVSAVSEVFGKSRGSAVAKGQATSVRKATSPKDGSKKKASETDSSERAVPRDSSVANVSAKDDYSYVGQWRGRRGKGHIGLGTVELISPSWAVTARHVASRKARDPNSVNVTVVFTKGVKAVVEKAYIAPKGDLALIKFKQPVVSIKPVALLSKPLVKKDGKIGFTMIGRSGGLHFHKNRRGTGNGKRVYHHKRNGSRPGKGGDSGGAWVVERDDKPDVLFSVIHGGGLGPQVAVVKEWINDHVKALGEKVQWVEKQDMLN